ncbi:MAG: helix-turn-helix transcriptional regulator [Elusimicrobia bacterium]|nr:helix-turn-helix transcriptional regulator [Elusimicrobiota bacterium]
MRSRSLSTCDILILSLLCEQPMHGYQMNQELENRDVRDWANISRPQVYYSLKKLEQMGMVSPAADAQPPVGPERRLCRINSSGRAALVKALGRKSWASQRTIPPFLTWLALSPHAGKDAVRAQLKARAEYLGRELERERKTLAALASETGVMAVPARLMVELTVKHFETELEWLKKAKKEILE